MRNRKTTGFTLVELLVVIAIISVLAGLLLAALVRSKGQSQSAKCVSNLRQMGIAAQLYWGDNNNRTFLYGGTAASTGALYWFGWIGPGAEETRPFDPRQGVLYPYSGDGVVICPSFDYSSSQFKLKASVPTCDYGYNWYLSSEPPLDMKSIHSPAAVILLADAAQVNTFEAPASVHNPMFEEWYYVNNDPQQPNGQFRHDHAANSVFCDGHIDRESMVAGSLDPRLPNQQIGFLPLALLQPQN